MTYSGAFLYPPLVTRCEPRALWEKKVNRFRYLGLCGLDFSPNNDRVKERGHYCRFLAS